MKRMILLALLVAGCATAQQTLDTALPKYRGKPVSLITQKWGMPDRTITIGDGTVYQWQATGPDGTCKLEAHAASRGAGGPQTVMGIRGVGDDNVCHAWIRMLL